MKRAAEITLRILVGLFSLALLCGGSFVCLWAFEEGPDGEGVASMLIGIFLVGAGILFFWVACFTRTEPFRRYLRQMLDGL